MIDDLDRALELDREKLIALDADPGPVFRTCDNCGGAGGFETVEIPSNKWGDPTPGGRWVACSECNGSGWVIGTPAPITIDDRESEI